MRSSWDFLLLRATCSERAARLSETARVAFRLQNILDAYQGDPAPRYRLPLAHIQMRLGEYILAKENLERALEGISDPELKALTERRLKSIAQRAG